MNKLILTLALIACLTACGRRVSENEKIMTNDEIISETKKCEAAGLDGEAVKAHWSPSIAQVNCIPRKHNEKAGK